MSNKSNGSSKERELAEELSKRGYWVHILADKIQGQPFDIIACKDGQCIAIDSKECEGDTFVLSRVEPNQETAMKLFKLCGNKWVGFAIHNENGWYWLSYNAYHNRALENTKSIRLSWLESLWKVLP